MVNKEYWWNELKLNRMYKFFGDYCLDVKILDKRIDSNGLPYVLVEILSYYRTQRKIYEHHGYFTDFYDLQN